MFFVLSQLICKLVTATNFYSFMVKKNMLVIGEKLERSVIYPSVVG